MPKFHNKKLLELYIKGIIAKKYTYSQAANTTNYTIHYLQRLKKRYILEGRSCFVNAKRGRQSPNRIKEEMRSYICKTYVNEYEGINFKFFSKLLKDDKSINYSYVTIRKILSEYGIRSPNSHKLKSNTEIHKPRFRRENEGDLSQIDATPFQWFLWDNNSKYYALHGAIDDATGKITGLYMTENECLYGYLELIRQTAKRFGGTPREIYSDRAAIFAVTPKNKHNLTIEEQLIGLHEKRTQWQRILEEIGTKQILAWSPQAKGRIERLWVTLQGRLPYLFKRNHIRTIEQANEFLYKYIDEYNKEFARPAFKKFNFYHPCTLDELDNILVAKFPRQIRSGYISFHDHKFIAEDYKGKDKIGLVCVNDKGLYYEIENHRYPLTLIEIPQFVNSDKMNTPQILYNIIYRCLFRFGKKEDYEPEEIKNEAS